MAQTHLKALIAYAALTRMGQKATGKAAFSLFRMKQKLEEVVRFQGEQERTLAEKHGTKIMEDGALIFPDDKAKAAFMEDKKALYDMEIDPEIEPIKVQIDQLPAINMEEIEALNGFIEFE